jgi:hypothetical protein
VVAGAGIVVSAMAVVVACRVVLAQDLRR